MRHHRKPKPERHHADIQPLHATEPIQKSSGAYAEHRLTPWQKTKQMPWANIIQFLMFIAVAVYAGLTYRLVELTQEQVHQGQKAYVLNESTRLESAPEVGKRLVTLIEMKNFGLTPATTVSVESKVVISAKEPWTFRFVFTQGKIQASNMGSSQVRRARGEDNHVLTQAEMAGIQNGTLKLYVVGGIQYTDIFRGINLTEFCNIFRPGLSELVSCSTHNTMTRIDAPDDYLPK